MGARQGPGSAVCPAAQPRLFPRLQGLRSDPATLGRRASSAVTPADPPHVALCPLSLNATRVPVASEGSSCSLTGHSGWVSVCLFCRSATGPQMPCSQHTRARHARPCVLTAPLCQCRATLSWGHTFPLPRPDAHVCHRGPSSFLLPGRLPGLVLSSDLGLNCSGGGVGTPSHRVCKCHRPVRCGSTCRSGQSVAGGRSAAVLLPGTHGWWAACRQMIAGQ